MKPSLLIAALVGVAAFTSLAAHAAVATAPMQPVSRSAVQADLYKAYLTDTTSEDEKYSFPDAPPDRAMISAHRCAEANLHPGDAADRAIVSQVCGS